jgi:Flp pilus assembly protein TadB
VRGVAGGRELLGRPGKHYERRQGFAISVTASAYGVTRVVTGHHNLHDIVVLLVGVTAAASIMIVFVRRHRRRRPKLAAG